MTKSVSDSTANHWSVPECPFQIETSVRVLDDIRLNIVDAFFSLPRGGAEIGGILLGSYQAGQLTIGDYATLECEHAFGPSFTLSPADETRLKALLAKHSGSAPGRRPVGWYHSHTRSEIFLSDADLEIHKRYFPESWQVALVIRPHTFEPARIGFFFREADGSMRTKASYRETVLEALPMHPVPRAVPTAAGSPAPSAETTLRRYRPELVETDRESAPVTVPVADPPKPAPEPDPETAPQLAAEVPVPRFLLAQPPASRRWAWVALAGLILGVVGAGLQTRYWWLPKMLSVVNPTPSNFFASSTLGLNTIDRDGQLQINWDRASRTLMHASGALLQINDGGALSQLIQLDRAQLQAGSFSYARQSEKVDVTLIVHRAEGPDLREVASFLGNLPVRKPSEDPEVQKQRDELARQAAKLTTDLNFQAAKTRKLERDLQAMREEMKQQQMKRLNNQLPEK